MYRYNSSNEGAPRRSVDFGVLVAVGTTVVLWASAFPGIRAGLVAYSPAHLAALRFLVASAALASFAAFVRMRLPDAADVPGIVLAGALGVAVYHLLLNAGELTVSAGAASFLANTIPVFTAILAWLVLGERLPAVGWAGIAVSMFGVGLIAVGDAGGFDMDRGVLFILASSASGAGYFVLQKHFMKKYSPLEFTAYAIWAGTLVLLLFSRGSRTPCVRPRAAPRPQSCTWGSFPRPSDTSLGAGCWPPGRRRKRRPPSSWSRGSHW